MTPEDTEAIYFVVLLALRGFGVLEAAEAARGLVARDCLAAWWTEES